MRTFQYSDAKSHKFWTIDVSGNSFTVTFGKIGSAGQTQTKSFPTADKARAEADKLIAEKTKKGYIETTPTAGGSEEAAFEKAILANPHDLTARSAYADFLAERGDPRGEFLQIQLALENEALPKRDRDALKKKEAALLKKHREEWLGPLADEKEADVSFARGGMRVVFPRLTVDQARALAKCPEGRLLRELIVLGAEIEAPVGSTEDYIDSFYEPGPDVPTGVEAYDEPGLHALCRCPHLGGVLLFHLGAGDAGVGAEEEEYFNCHTSGELAYHLVKQMPHAEELYLFAHRVDANKLFALPMPNLRVLQLYHSNSYPLDKLAANKSLTNLTTLLCHPHALELDDEVTGANIRFAHLKAVCRSPHLTSLTHLRLRLTDFGDKGAKEIVESGILKRLKTLDLQGGCIGDAGAKTLADCPDLKNLEFLNLRANALTKAGVKAIKATGVKADTAAQHDMSGGDFGGDELPEYLFEGDIE